MLKLINNKEAIANLNKYMFTPATMKKLAHGPVAVSAAPHALGPASHGPASHALLPVPIVSASLAHALLPVPRPVVSASHAHALLPVPSARSAKPFVPFQKDKLFW